MRRGSGPAGAPRTAEAARARRSAYYRSLLLLGFGTLVMLASMLAGAVVARLFTP